MAELLHGIVLLFLFLLYAFACSAVLGSESETTEETVYMLKHGSCNVFLKNFSFFDTFSCCESNFPPYYFLTSFCFLNSEPKHCIFLNHQFEMVSTLLVLNQSDSFKIFCINILPDFVKGKATLFETHFILKEYPPIFKFQQCKTMYCGWMGGCAETYNQGKSVTQLKLLFLLTAKFFGSSQTQTGRYSFHIRIMSQGTRTNRKLSYLLIFLLLCGDVHPNPGPLQPHRRHPGAESIVVGSWNVRTLLTRKRSHIRPTAVVARMLNSHNIDICALSETRLFGDHVITEHGAGYTFFLKGLPEGERQIHGVGIAIRSKLLADLKGNYPAGTNARLMKMVFPLKRCMLHIISAYAPTAGHDDDKDQFYDQLNQLFKEIPASDKILLLGDFNARVGADHEGWDGVLGSHGIGSENANGTTLLSFCSQNGLVITNTLFQQADRFKTTWMHPRTKKWHMIDYVITRQKDAKDVHHTRAMCGTCDWTDHRLVKSKLALRPRKRVRHHRINPIRKLNVVKLQSLSVRQSLADKLSKAFANTDISGEDLDTTLNNFTKPVLQVSKEVLGYCERKHRDWFDENDQTIQPMLTELHDLNCQINVDKDDIVLNAAYRTKKQEVQHHLRAMENSWWMDRAHDIQTAADKRDYKSLYQSLKAVYGPKIRKYPSIKSKDGKSLLTDPTSILSRWVEHFDSVLNQPSTFDQNVLEMIPQWEVNAGLADPPSLEEIEVSIKQLTAGKAPGADGIPPDVFKYGGPAIRNQLLTLFQKCWNVGTVPKAFKDAELIHLYKNKGDIKCCDNHRGITLLCIAGKIFARLLLNRLVQHLVIIELIPESQCGFMTGRSTIDPCFSLRQLQEKCWHRNRDLYILFVDLQKAFDTVNREALWALLQKIGCPEQFISIIRSFHDGMEITVREGSERAAPFTVLSGTKQGCVLAPTLFSIFFSCVLLVAFNNTTEGIEIWSRFDRGLCNTHNVHYKAVTKTTSTIIRDLLFADDCALASSSEEGLQQLCNELAFAASKFGLKISIDKTKSMYQAPRGARYVPPEIFVEGNQLEAVKTFKYLGSIVSDSNSMDEEITTRLARANSAFNALTKRLWCKNGIRTGTKISVYKAAVISTLLYGSEAWTLTKRQIRKLEKFHLTCLRKIARIRWYHKVPNFMVLKRCHVLSVTSMLDRNKLRWTGHVIRMADDRIPKRILYGQLARGYSRQGNHLTYMNSLRRTLRVCGVEGRNLEQLANDRSLWRHVVNAGIEDAEKGVLAGLEQKYLCNREKRLGRMAHN